MTSSLSGFSGMRDNTGGGTRGGFTGDIIPKGHRVGQLQQFTPEQMQLYQQMFLHAGPESYLSRLASGDQSMFAEMEAPAQRQFSEQLGGLASRFSGMGGLGARRSSGFQNTGTAAASNFSQDLAARRQALQRQAILDLQGLSESLLNQRPYQRDLFQKPQQSGGWGSAASGALSGGISGSALGPWGALGGALIGGTAGYFS